VEPAPGNLVLVPNDGFRRQWAITSPANVVVERDGRTLTAAVFPERDRNLLEVTVIGVDPPAPFPTETEVWRDPSNTAELRDEHVRGITIAPPNNWMSAGPVLTGRGDGGGMFTWLFELGEMPGEIQTVDLSLGGPGGDWIVQIPVAMTETVGIPARDCDIVDIHQQVAIRATAVARSPELSAVELETFCVDAAGKKIRDSKWLSFPMRMVDRLWLAESTLRDDRGGLFREEGGPRFGGARLRQSAWFVGVPSAVNSAVLEIPFVETKEIENLTVKLPIPSETDVEYDGCATRVSTATVSARDGRRVHVEFASLDPAADRQLLYFKTAYVDDGPTIGTSIARLPGRAPIVETPDPSGRAQAVTLSYPIMLGAGPWRLPLTFD